ncbi:lipid asymmetry maintenance protein MlaB [Thermodesulfobacteriota bacterium]
MKYGPEEGGKLLNMGTQQFTITQDANGTFFLKGELTLLDLEYFQEFLDGTRARVKRFSLDMSGVAYADTASLQLLIAFKKNAKPEHECRIVAMSPELDQIVKICGLKPLLID